MKIYKTSILVFKDRDRYVSGEFRFRHGYAKHNPRKMVRLWAEKEARNLKRMVAAGLRAPIPVELRDHVLVMQFLGDADGWAKPAAEGRRRDDRLGTSPPGRDSTGSSSRACASCTTSAGSCTPTERVQTSSTTRRICVHRYVSQSVEHDPARVRLLRADIGHVDEYFAKRGVHTLGLRRTFEFVAPSRPRGAERAVGRGWKSRRRISTKTTSRIPTPSSDRQLRMATASQAASVTTKTVEEPAATSKVMAEARGYTGLNTSTAAAPASQSTGENEASLMQALESLMEQLSVEPTTDEARDDGGVDSKPHAETADTAKTDEAVFKQTYIPFSLHEMDDPEREIERQQRETPRPSPTPPPPRTTTTTMTRAPFRTDSGSDSDEDAPCIQRTAAAAHQGGSAKPQEAGQEGDQGGQPREAQDQDAQGREETSHQKESQVVAPVHPGQCRR